MDTLFGVKELIPMVKQLKKQIDTKNKLVLKNPSFKSKEPSVGGRKKHFKFKSTEKQERFRKLFLRTFRRKNQFLVSRRAWVTGLKNLDSCLSLKIAANNIFCTGWSRKNQRLLRSLNSGSIGMKLSKKNLRFFLRPIVETFFSRVSPLLGKSVVSCKIIAPRRIKKSVFRVVSELVKVRGSVFYQVEDKKCFNGCRVKKKCRKKRRKKRRALRSFKG